MSYSSCLSRGAEVFDLRTGGEQRLKKATREMVRKQVEKMDFSLRPSVTSSPAVRTGSRGGKYTEAVTKEREGSGRSSGTAVGCKMDRGLKGSGRGRLTSLEDRQVALLDDYVLSPRA